MNAVEAAEKSGNKDQLLAELNALAKAENTNSTGRTNILATFMRVTVQT